MSFFIREDLLKHEPGRGIIFLDGKLNMFLVLLDRSILFCKVILHHFLEVSAFNDGFWFLGRCSAKIDNALCKLLCVSHLILCCGFEYLKDGRAFYSLSLIMMFHILYDRGQFGFSVLV